MRMAIESMVDFILLVLLILISLSFIMLHLNEQKARNFHALAVDEIENSHFSQAVTKGLVMEAKRQGYELHVTSREINGEPMAEVKLDYVYAIPFMQISNQPRSIRGTAR